MFIWTRRVRLFAKRPKVFHSESKNNLKYFFPKQRFFFLKMILSVIANLTQNDSEIESFCKIRTQLKNFEFF